MNKDIYKDALEIINDSINEVLPEKLLIPFLQSFKVSKGKTIMIAIGKAAYNMAKTTLSMIPIDEGLVITKYNHSKGNLKNTTIIEAGHPIPDENSIKGTEKAIEMCSNLTKDDVVLMMISGGGSSLFESPFIDLKQLQDITDQLIKSGADIQKINTVRKRLSKVKGGKFAEICKPAKVINFILSDVIGNPLDMIASGPTYPDKSSQDDALNIISTYNIKVSEEAKKCFNERIISKLDNIENHIIGSNENLKLAAENKAKEFGYKVVYMPNPLLCDVEESTSIFTNKILELKNSKENICLLGGGEITVKVKGKGLGGRNTEFACRMIKNLPTNSCFFAVGSDGTDGPTDAAGGYVENGLYNEEIDDYLNNNDSYHYLEKHNGLIKTGPTGTNVCDLYCSLIVSKHNNR